MSTYLMSEQRLAKYNHIKEFLKQNNCEIEEDYVVDFDKDANPIRTDHIWHTTKTKENYYTALSNLKPEQINTDVFYMDIKNHTMAFHINQNDKMFMAQIKKDFENRDKTITPRDTLEKFANTFIKTAAIVVTPEKIVVETPDIEPQTTKDWVSHLNHKWQDYNQTSGMQHSK